MCQDAKSKLTRRWVRKVAKRQRATRAFKEKIRRDVELVRAKAAIVLEVSQEDKVKIFFNQNPALGVIAIIGPGKVYGQYFPEAVLEEIGLGKSRPFHNAKTPKEFCEKGTSRHISCRNNFFGLNKNQYLAIVPIVFRLLQQLANYRAARWQYQSFFSFDEHYLYDQKRKKDWVYGKIRAWPRGGRFSVRKNSFFAADIFWLLFNQQPTVDYLRGLARYIVRRLERVNKNWQGNTNFVELSAVQVILRNINSKKTLSRYLLIEMFFFLPPAKNYRLWPFIADLLGWEESLSHEKQKALEALPDAKYRVGKINLRIMRQLKLSKDKDHIVFEVVARHEESDNNISAILAEKKTIRQQAKKEYAYSPELLAELSAMSDDDLPF